MPSVSLPIQLPVTIPIVNRKPLRYSYRMRNLGREFAGIVEQRLKELSKKPFAVETEHNLPPDSIRNVLRSGNAAGPTLSKVQQICDALDLEIYIGARRRPTGFSETAEVSDLGGGKADKPWHLPLPWHHLTPRPGSAPMAFEVSWFAQHGLTIDDIRAVALDASTLALPHGGELIALVDVSSPREGRSSWAVKADGRAVAATVEFLPDATLIFGAHADGSSIIQPKYAGVPAQLLGKIQWLGMLTT